MNLQNLEKGINKLGPVMAELPNFIFRAYKLGQDILSSASPEHRAEFTHLVGGLKAISRKIEIVLEREDVISLLRKNEYQSENEQLWSHSDIPTVVLLEDIILFNNKPIRFSEWVLECNLEDFLEQGEENA